MRWTGESTAFSYLGGVAALLAGFGLIGLTDGLVGSTLVVGGTLEVIVAIAFTVTGLEP